MRVARPFLPLVVAGLGIGTSASHWLRPLGTLGDPARVLAATATDPAFLVALLFVPAVLAVAPLAAPLLVPGLEEAPLRARRRALEPFALGAGAPLAAIVLDPWLWGCPAPALLWTGAGVGALAAAWRLLALRPRTAPPPQGTRVAAVAGLLALLIVPGWPGPQGDEPHYLLVASSVAHDRDLDLAADYARGDYRAFHPTPLSPHYKPGTTPGSRYSMHGVGYGVLLSPVVLASDALGLRSPVLPARVLQALAFGLFAWLLYGLLASLVDERAATLGTAAAVLPAPLLLAPAHLFPETWLMLLAVAGYRLAGDERLRGRLVAGVALALLPWLAVKTIPMALVVAALGCWAHRAGGAWRRTVPVFAPLAVSLALHAVFTWVLYGSLSPSAIYLGSDPSFGRAPAHGDSLLAYLAEWPLALRTLVGYFVDQKEGLLFTGPQWLLAVAGLPWVWRRRRRHAIALALAFAAYVGPYALSQQISGQSPPSRPLMAVLWTLALPLGVALAAAVRPAVQVLRGLLVGAAVALTAAFLADPSLLPHDYPVTRSWLIRSLSPRGSGLADWFPLWLNVREAWPWLVASSWLVAVTLVGVVLVRGRARLPQPGRWPRPDRRSWVAAAGAVIVAGAIMLYGANLVVTDRHVGADLGDGVVAWVRYALPETAWAESGGVWAAPGVPRRVVLTARPALAAATVRLRTMVPTRTVAWLDGTRVEPAAGERTLRVDWKPGRGSRWRGGFAYRVVLYAAAGASPAEVEGGEDHRQLGVFLQVQRQAERQRLGREDER